MHLDAPASDAVDAVDGAGGAAVEASTDGQSADADGIADTGGVVEAGSQRDAVSEVPDAPALPRILELSGDLGLHDPAIIEAQGEYLVFSTGRGVRLKRSDDLLGWQEAGSVFKSNPSWIAASVPAARDLWAPDISFFGGRYHLYYSASSFGSRKSCIGHATASAPQGLFVDDGAPVICSDESDEWNAIDPNAIVDDSGQAWLAFGSFWSGIKLIRLNDAGVREGAAFHDLASRDGAAIEAPFIVRRGGYYYLFVSFDYCCLGVASTYRIMVGRSESVVGPYVDADGVPMMSGGGTQLVIGNQRWRGPGHNAVLFDEAGSFLVYHAYDFDESGAARLRIIELVWDDEGWPVPGGP